MGHRPHGPRLQSCEAKLPPLPPPGSCTPGPGGHMRIQVAVAYSPAHQANAFRLLTSLIPCRWRLRCRLLRPTTDDHKQGTLVILCNGGSLTFASSGSKSAGTSKKEQQLLVQHSVKREQHMPSSWPSLKPWPKIENCLQIFFHRWQHMLPYFY